MNKKELLLSLLFVAKEPLSPESICKIMDEEIRTVNRWIAELEFEFKERGIRIRRVAGGFEMVTSEQAYEYVQQLAPKVYESLSKSCQETVTLIAHLQPVTRAVIAKYRKVKNPDSGIESLLQKGMIKETQDGYITTDVFLRHFGVNDLAELHEKLSKISVLEKEE